jgi:hypothetical protein
MKNNVTTTMSLPNIMNPMTWLWRFLAFLQTIAHKVPKYLKLVKIAMVQVIGLVEHERCFNNLNFIKSKLHRRLTTYLDLVF